MIEAKKLAYADMLRYVADPQVHRRCRSLPMLEQGARGKARAALIDPAKAACAVEPSHARRD